MHRTFNTNLLILLTLSLSAQGFTNWITGDTSDFVTNQYQGGIVLAGGGTDNDDAMKWMLQRAGGGDVVVIRASNSDGYNDYFFSELGVNVNSVETIRFEDIAASTDNYVINQIRNAEVLFMAGGDQYDYYQFWKDNAIEDAINYLINEKGITVGGTSAGMAILGEAYYTPSGGSLTSDEGLANPFHPDINILGKGDFIQNPWLANTITDTHYDQRDRQGRQMTFMARLTSDFNIQPHGIACNEVTAVCIDESGIATIFGEYPDYDDYAYFIKSNCQNEFKPENLFPDSPLTWNRNQAAVKVYKVPGMVSGSTTFDLNTWEAGEGGTWEAWYVEEGELLKVLDSNSNCDETTDLEIIDSDTAFEIFPNPFLESFTLNFNDDFEGFYSIRILNNLGQIVWASQMTEKAQTYFPRLNSSGNFILEIQNGTTISRRKIIRR